MDTFLQPLLNKLSYENKNVILLDNFNIDLLHYELHIQLREFLDKIYFGFLLPQVTIPTRITPHPWTLIYILANVVDKFSISGNLACSFFDHLAWFLIYPEQNAKACLPKWKIKIQKKLQKNNKDIFEQDLKHINWAETLKVNDQNIDTSLENN